MSSCQNPCYKEVCYKGMALLLLLQEAFAAIYVEKTKQFRIHADRFNKSIGVIKLQNL